MASVSDPQENELKSIDFNRHTDKSTILFILMMKEDIKSANKKKIENKELEKFIRHESGNRSLSKNLIPLTLNIYVKSKRRN